jgi:RNA polymerase sigma-70 factor (ECF subfamily)
MFRIAPTLRRKEIAVNTDLNATAPYISDLDLVRKAKEGDPDAFATLFYTHKARVYSLCLRMTNNTAEAEDLTQDAFLQVFRKLATFRGDSALSTWLYRVAVNTVLMHFRKKGLRQVSLDEPSSQDTRMVKREYGNLDDQLSGSVDRITLARAMKELPAGYRTIFLLHEVKGYEHQEIARLLRCSVGNSKSQLHKAKLKMRELLARGREQLAEAAPPEKRPNRTRQKPARSATRKASPAWASPDVELGINNSIAFPLGERPPRWLTETGA